MADFNVDFSPIGKLGEIYRQAQQRNVRDQALAQLSQGTGPLDYNAAARAMFAGGAADEGLSLAKLAQQQYLTSPEYITKAKTAEAQVAEQFAPKTVDITRPGGDKFTVQKGTTGYVLPTVQGETATGDGIPPAPPGTDVKEWRKIHTDALAKAQQALPGIEAQVGQTLKSIQDVRNDPYKSWGTGITSPLARVPGTPLYDFGQRVEQLKGKTFLEAYTALKGGGAITEVEGAKGTAAVARLSTAQTQKAFDEALNDLEDVVKTGLDRARLLAKPGGVAQANSAQQPATPGATPQAAPKPQTQFNWNTRETITSARQNPQEAITQAKAAVAKGMPPAEAIRRLQAAGIPVDASTFGATP